MENHHHHHHPLPPEIIHHIQSFLNANEAAQSALLSNSWRSAWYTRPNLDFSQPHFGRGRRYIEKFPDFVEKSMQRYEQRGLRIDSFRLDSFDSFHANEWIVKAMKLGAVAIDIRIWDARSSSFVLADELLLSETLNNLSLRGSFTIDHLRLASPKLKSLCLKHVHVNVDENHDLFMDLLSRFPSLERLELLGIKLPKFVKLEYDHYKLEYLHLEHLKLSVDGDLIILPNSPFLKKLVILNCPGLQNIRICSKSLEHVSIQRPYFSSAKISASWETELYVPNIRKFKFEGFGWSRLVLKTTARREWGSDISLNYSEFDIGVNYSDRSNAERFIMLNKVLNDQFSLSRVSLSFPVDFGMNNDCVGLVRAAGLPTVPPIVENLMVMDGRVTDAFLDALFLVCRPKAMIVRKWLSSDHARDKKYLFELINKRVIVEKVFLEVDHTPSPFHDVGFRLRW